MKFINIGPIQINLEFVESVDIVKCRPLQDREANWIEAYVIEFQMSSGAKHRTDVRMPYNQALEQLRIYVSLKGETHV
jgi:hypothetical protein